jgi:hypothetical protein
MDGMMGKHFESGLRNLKNAAENNAAQPLPAKNP